MSDTHGVAAPAENEYGLSAEEQAAFNDMRSQPAPQGDAGFVSPDAPADVPAANGAAPDAGAAPADPPKPAAAAGAAAPAPAAGAVAPPATGGPAGGAVDADAGDDDEPDPTPNADGTAKPPKRVSYNKFKRVQDDATKAAADLKAAQEANVKMTETQARLDERLKLINEALATPAPAAAAPEDDDPEPDAEKDIFSHNAWLKRQLVKTQAQVQQLSGNLEEGAKMSAAEQEMADTYLADATRFAADEPNFGPAYNYLMQVRIAQLANYHYGIDVTDPNVTPLTVQQVRKIKSEIAREEKQLVTKAIAANKSPAAAVFAMAKMTGFRPAAPGAAPANGAAAPPTGAAATAAAAVAAAAPAAPAAATNGAAPTQPTVKDEIARIKAGQDAALTLSGGGGAPAPVLNAQKLADMPDDEFGQLLDQMSRGELRRIMGGA